MITCPKYAHEAAKVPGEIAGDIEDCRYCATCERSYLLIRGRWYDVALSPKPAQEPR
jgi:hypothetical protein